jgi:hypothetical protein
MASHRIFDNLLAASHPDIHKDDTSRSFNATGSESDLAGPPSHLRADIRPNSEIHDPVRTASFLRQYSSPNHVWLARSLPLNLQGAEAHNNQRG